MTNTKFLSNHHEFINLYRFSKTNNFTTDPKLKLNKFKQQFRLLGHEVKDLDKLNIIHVAGTKGKGSTCLFSQQILRSIPGLKIGMFTSPHILEARERIKLNGSPISYEKFVKIFEHCFSRLKGAINEIGYFQFLTLMGFHLMLSERVDAFIVEVGIGGLYDYTNIVQKPVVCGITKIDYDHQNILGNTLEDIARNKAGIIKPGVPCFTINDQVKNVFNVLVEEAVKNESVIETSQQYFNNDNQLLGIEGEHQYSNANLAMSLCVFWCKKVLKTVNINILWKDIIAENILNTKFMGRSYRYNYKSIEFYLDGAHTESSLQMCMEWFSKVAKSKPIPLEQKPRILLMGIAKGRDCYKFIEIVHKYNHKHKMFTEVIFAPNILDKTRDGKLMKINNDLFVPEKVIKDVIELNYNQKMSNHWNNLNIKNFDNTHYTNSRYFNSLKEAIGEIIERGPDLVLVTGSLHLVGGVLTLLDHPISE